MARNEDEDYDWINDPFDESKNDVDQAKMPKGMKASISIALVLAVVAVIAMFVFALGGIMSLYS